LKRAPICLSLAAGNFDETRAGVKRFETLAGKNIMEDV